jgi:hypothetical protein
LLKTFVNSTLEIKCNTCGAEFSTLIDSGYTSNFQPEFNAYTNFNSNPCPSCKSIEVFNMNIPTDETAESDAEAEMPYEEINQRHYVRQLIKAVREDFKNAAIKNSKR